MSVVIDELVTETIPEGTRSAPAASGGGNGGGDREPDLDRFDYLMRRRTHRAERLSAD